MRELAPLDVRVYGISCSYLLCPSGSLFTWKASIWGDSLKQSRGMGTSLCWRTCFGHAIYLFIPPARRAMDTEDKAFPGTEYANQQPLLVRITLFTLPAAFVLSVIGSLLT
jgi:hypothetical protein